MLELYGINELSEGTFLTSSNTIDLYHQEHTALLEKLNSAEYQKGSFCGDRNTIENVTYRKVIPQKLKKYVVKWYHMYLLHPGLD